MRAATGGVNSALTIICPEQLFTSEAYSSRVLDIKDITPAHLGADGQVVYKPLDIGADSTVDTLPGYSDRVVMSLIED